MYSVYPYQILFRKIENINCVSSTCHINVLLLLNVLVRKVRIFHVLTVKKLFIT